MRTRDEIVDVIVDPATTPKEIAAGSREPPLTRASTGGDPRPSPPPIRRANAPGPARISVTIGGPVSDSVRRTSSTFPAIIPSGSTSCRSSRCRPAEQTPACGRLLHVAGMIQLV